MSGLTLAQHGAADVHVDSSQGPGGKRNGIVFAIRRHGADQAQASFLEEIGPLILALSGGEEAGVMTQMNADQADVFRDQIALQFGQRLNEFFRRRLLTLCGKIPNRLRSIAGTGKVTLSLH